MRVGGGAPGGLGANQEGGPVNSGPRAWRGRGPEGGLGFGTRISVGWGGLEKRVLSVGVELSGAPGQWDVGRQGRTWRGEAVVTVWAGLRGAGPLGELGVGSRASLTFCALPAALPAEMFTS